MERWLRLHMYLQGRISGYYECISSCPTYNNLESSRCYMVRVDGNVALSPDVPSLMARLWIPQRSRLHSPSYLPSVEDMSISDPTQTTPPWDPEDTPTCLEAEMSVSTRDVSTSRVSHGVTVATLTVDVTTHPLDSSLAHLDVQSTPNCHLSVLWTLFLVTVARN